MTNALDAVRVDFISRSEGLWLVWSHMYLPTDEFRYEFLPALRVAAGMPAASLRSEGGGRWSFAQSDIELYGLDHERVIGSIKEFLTDYFGRMSRMVEFTTSDARGS